MDDGEQDGPEDEWPPRLERRGAQRDLTGVLAGERWQATWVHEPLVGPERGCWAVTYRGRTLFVAPPLQPIADEDDLVTFLEARLREEAGPWVDGWL